MMWDERRSGAQAVVADILAQHMEEAAFLWELRGRAVHAANYTLADLAALDERIEAHLDALRISGASGTDVLTSQNALASGEFFTAAALDLETDDVGAVDRLLAGFGTNGGALRGIVAAIGWLPERRQAAWIERIERGGSPIHRLVALAAAASSRSAVLDLDLARAIEDEDSSTRARALRAVGQMKRRELLGRVSASMASGDESCRFAAACSAALLGDRRAAAPLREFTARSARYGDSAMWLAARLSTPAEAREWLKELARSPATRRRAIVGCGMVGDPVYVPALIRQMADAPFSRVAGEAFAAITGVDLEYEDLVGERPEGIETGPSEDPDDEDVAMDPDEELPWPDITLVQRWWNENGGRFVPGRRYLCGRTIDEASCRRVLREGYQRQRIAAAYELALMNPDEPLFAWRAPGFRQQEWLGSRRSM